MKVSKYKIGENLWRCECGKEFNKYQSLNAHLSHCDYHHKCLGTVRKLRPSELNHSNNWENKTEAELKEIHLKNHGGPIHKTEINRLFKKGIESMCKILIRKDEKKGTGT